jgi:hypothetical protein
MLDSLSGSFGCLLALEHKRGLFVTRECHNITVRSGVSCGRWHLIGAGWRVEVDDAIRLDDQDFRF